MSLNPKISNEAANAAVDALCTLLNGGYLDIYDNTSPGQPATADTAVTTQVKLARLTFRTLGAGGAFGAAVAGVATAAAITQDSSADASGTAAWCRMVKSDESPVVDGSCGTASADLVLNSVAISAGAAVAVTALTVTLPKS